jgi:hypothetical protein
MEDVFVPSRAVVLSELQHVRDKERYYQLLLDSGAKFVQDEHGNYIASMRMLAPGVKSDLGVDGKNKKAEYAPVLLPYEQRMQSINENGFVSVSIAGKEQFDYSPYPRFVTLISDNGDIVKPKSRILSWMMKLIEDVYDARFASEKSDNNDTNPNEDDEAGRAGTQSASKKRDATGGVHLKVFPIFVCRRLSLTMGLKKVVDQACWDLLYNVDKYRKDYLEVEVFARFLQEFYDYQDLLFFLYVRSVVSSVLHVTFRNKWTRPENGANAGTKNIQALWMSYRECVQVARIVFGEENEEMTKDFLALLAPHMVGTRSDTKDSRRIDITQFLHLAVVGYHQTQAHNEEGGESNNDETNTAINVNFQGGGGAVVRGTSMSGGLSPQGVSVGHGNQAMMAHGGSSIDGHGYGQNISLSTLAASGNEISAKDRQDMEEVQASREKEFLDYVTTPLQQRVEKKSISQSKANTIYDELNGILHTYVSDVIGPLHTHGDVDTFDEKLIAVLRDGNLLKEMENKLKALLP